MKDYLKDFNDNTGVQKFQMGGAMPAPESAPAEGGAPMEAAPQGGGDLEGMIAQVVETQDPNLALEVVNMIAEQAGLGAAPAAPAPATDAPVAAPAEGIPQGRFGMKVPKVRSTLIQK